MKKLLQSVTLCIIREMYRAEVEPMSPDTDLVPRMGLYKVVVYEGERFVRTDKETKSSLLQRGEPRS